MGLATIIRLEFAYPGVGVLAGDSIQYLSIATAHGVIMVFFMIMPSVFGAFGNFLLPTQLGVHDVAFPRLNSAAFWFLPGGLIMLAQLVCVDRRYQRMNCFNIRELQGILKRKFFTDLVNTSDHRHLLDKTAVGLRFKTNSNLGINSDTLSFYNYGTSTVSANKSTLLGTNHSVLSVPSNGALPFTAGQFSLNAAASSFASTGSVAKTMLSESLACVLSLNPASLTSFTFFPTAFRDVAALNTNLGAYALNTLPSAPSTNDSSSAASVIYSSENLDANLLQDSTSALLSETSAMPRFTRFNNPLLSYDYKCGNYLGI